MKEPDITQHEKVTKTEVGFKIEITSKRGTGTRDEDKVKATLKAEEYPGEPELESLRSDIHTTMAELRSFQPDQEEDS